MAEFINFDFPFPPNERINEIWSQISSIRHDVYADELQQYDSNPERKIQDPGNHFIACVEGEKLIGYISLNSPSSQPLRLTKYFSEEVLNQTVYDLCDNKGKSTFEVRGLTISSQYRGRNLSLRLMRHALEFVVENGGTDIVAMGHTDVLKLYENNGMRVFRNVGVKHGKTVYYPMHMKVKTTLRKFAKKIQEDINQENSDDACYHGGQSWDTSKFDFEVRKSLIVADVLDSPFPPCPEVLEILSEQLERCCQESPPTQCDELIETIAEVRDVPINHVAVSSGSSSLMFSLLPQLLNEQSRVLLLSPMYGEYSHILEQVIGCHITYFVLEDKDDFSINLEDLISQSLEHDAVIFVNPNSPTGVYCESMSQIVKKIGQSGNPSSKCKMIWIDETYINYISNANSLELLSSSIPELIVCKSMSKCYALSGLRVAYAVSQQMQKIKKFIPPWAVSLPGQLAAVAALRDKEYYSKQYDLIHSERKKMQKSLESIGFQVFPGVANYLLTYLPSDSGYSSTKFVEDCKSRGLFVRDAQNMGVSLPSNAVRFAIRSIDENKKMLEIITSILQSGTI
jgi:histidinol-phosphate/aromatic aminotransferase/cobyric acid decarboxylase-like protein/ribosomal protein S18 acetylase RimI-like enzyme